MILIQELSGDGLQTITFSSIGGTYKSLYCLLNGASLAGSVTFDTAVVRINGASGASDYAWQYLRGQAATASAAEDVDLDYIHAGLIPAADAPAGSSGFIEVIIPNYATTTFHKSVRVKTGMRSGTGTGGMVIQETAGFYLATTAVTSLSIIAAGGNFANGTKAALYGMP